MVVSLRLTPRFLEPSAAADDARRRRVEQTLAVARLVLATAGLTAIWIDPSEPDRFTTLAYGLLIGYVGFSGIVLVLVNLRKSISPGLVWSVHLTSAVWAGVISVFTSGPSSAFFVFFVFVILAAAFRWRMRETLITTALLVMMVLGQALLLIYGPTHEFLGGDIEVDRTIMRSAYLLIMGIFVGFLGEKEKQLAAELSMLTKLTSIPKVSEGLRGSGRGVLEALMPLFGCENAVLVLHETTANTFARLELRSAPGASAIADWHEVTAREAAPLLFPIAEFTARLVKREEVSVDYVESASNRLRPGGALVLVPPLASKFSCGLLVADAHAGSDWRMRLLLLDPAHGLRSDVPVLFLDKAVHQISPAFHNVCLTGRLRDQASASERARVARELHDGAIQTLASANIQLASLRDRLAENAGAAADAERVRVILQKEVLNLRELMHSLRPVAVSASELPDTIGDALHHFQQETGIMAEFVCDDAELPLSPEACRELTKILQEALTNVRKHSHASHVLVTLRRDDNVCRLVVDDDGQGFGFAGEFSLDDLDRQRRGPIVIKERVRAMGGKLIIRSAAGEGSQLEITLPLTIGALDE